MLLRMWFAAICLGMFAATSALADDWVAVKLRGQVLQLVANQWQPLVRGDVVSDDRVVRTLWNGRVEFHRDAEVISLGPQTQIQIHDKTGERFTTVQQYFGAVSVDAEARNVQHFEVRTPFLVAVVKGTHFVVRSGKHGSSVQVQRGHVAVESKITHSTTVVSAGQSAIAKDSADLQVDGKGDLPPVIAADGTVISENGVPIAGTVDLTKLAKQLKEKASKATGEEKRALERAAKAAEDAANEAADGANKTSESEKKTTEATNKSEKDASKQSEKKVEAATEGDKPPKK